MFGADNIIKLSHNGPRPEPDDKLGSPCADKWDTRHISAEKVSLTRILALFRALFIDFETKLK